jgi:hypothetical protein
MRRKRKNPKVENVIAAFKETYQSNRTVFVRQYASSTIFNAIPPSVGDEMRRALVSASVSRTFTIDYQGKFFGQDFTSVLSLAELHLAKMADEAEFLPGRNLTAWMWPVIDGNFHFTLIPASRRKK